MRFPAVLDNFIQSRLAILRVALPGRVVSYDSASQRVDVQPSVEDGYLDENEQRQSVPLPIVTNVPIVFPGSGPFRITFPISPGDPVLLVIASSSIARWKATTRASSRTADSGDDQHHALEDAIAIPGLSAAPLAEQPVDDALVVHAEEIRLGGRDATEPVALKKTLERMLEILDAAAGADVTGACAAIHTALTAPAANWPAGAVASSTKAK